jgi:exosortase family protein XrtG
VNGKLIDEKTTQFYSVPTIGEFLARLGVPPSAVVVVGTAIWLGLLAFLRSRRRWLSFYGLGVLGGVIVSLFVAQLLGFDQRLEAIEASTVAAVASALGLKLEVLGGSGLAIKNHVGWGVFDIGIECSALIEMAALAGLVGFYPAFSAKRKGTSVAVGVAATFAFNIVRILLIVGIIAWLGTAWVFPAHAVIGRIFFFTAIILLFWWLMTRPTIHLVRAKVEARVAAGEACDG